MASNLNKAFMRAYAKDRQQPPPDAQAAAQVEVAHQVRATTPVRGAAAAASQQAVRTPPPAPKVLTGRFVQAPAAPTHAPQNKVAADRATEASSVWQRIDAAQAVQAPHVTSQPTRPVAASVGAGSVTGPRRMHSNAAAAVPSPQVARDARTSIHGQPQPFDMPLLGDDHEPSAIADQRAIEARRRTVADFLYAAGQERTVAAAASAPKQPARTATVAAANPRAAAMPQTTASPAGRQPAAGRSVGSTTFEPAPVASSASMPMPQTFQAAAAVSTPQAPPTSSPRPFATTEPAAADRQPSQVMRSGNIVRVDVPRGVRSAASPAAQATAFAANPNGTAAEMPGTRQAATQPAARMPAEQFARDQFTRDQHAREQHAREQYAREQATLEQLTQGQIAREHAGPTAVGEQLRVDRAHQLNAVEQQLRRDKHAIFNPVWEVDALQWPSVCDKLMAHRAESMSQVAAHLKIACQDGLSVLGVTSPGNGEGRTTVACCLARLAAGHGLNVVLVDLDLDHPTLCLQTNLEIEHDWRDCLTEDIPLEEVAVHSIDDQLTLLPLKARGSRQGLLASDSRIAKMLAQLSESFELVIVDTSRVHSSGNVITGLAFTEIFDASIVVVDRRNSDQARIEDAVQSLQETGIESIGIVDNFSIG